MNEQLEHQIVPAKLIYFLNEANRIPAHWHNNLEIEYVCEGVMGLLENGQQRWIYPGGVRFINSGAVHLLRAPTPQETLGITIVFSRNFMKQIHADVENLVFDWDHCPEQQPAFLQAIAPVYQLCKSRYERGLPTVFDGHDSCEYLLVNSCLYRIAYLMMTYFLVKNGPEASSRRSQNNPKIQQAIDYLEEHYHTGLMAPEVARHIGVSREYFSRNFKKYTGLTFSEYLNSIRLTFAYRQLLSTGLPVLDIALSAGFPDVRAFSRHFKKRYGCPPGEYRRKYIQKRMSQNEQAQVKNCTEMSEDIR